MPEAWNISPDKARQSDKTTTFILFCEDGINEPTYFRSFQKPGVKVNVAENQSSGFRNFVKALMYCEKNGLFEEVEERYIVKSDITNHIWSVFDRDVDRSTPTPEKQDQHRTKLAEDDMNFTTSIKQAEAARIKVAWSNDAFELWILLHFEDVTPAVAIYREQVYTRLTEIFKALPDQSAEMLKITGNGQFNYKENAKRGKFFIQYVNPLLMPRLQQAIQRAQTLEAAFSAKHRYHEMNPCTKVHHLVNSLLHFRETEE